jgi:hypothetical protein
MGPRSTRNCHVLTFEDATPLLVDVVDDQEPTDQPSLQASTTSRLLYVRRISTGRRCDAAESTSCSLELSFFDSDASLVIDRPILTLKVRMPQLWTARMYLAVLFVTMTTHSGIYVKKLEPTHEVDRTFNSLNNVHSFFVCDNDELVNILESQNALSKVR